jgi:Ni/Co efflux regulator RcnB
MDALKRERDERGSALLISLLVLLSLTLIGGLFMAQTKTETQIAGHDVRSNQALYHAEAGYGEVLARMSDHRDTTNFIGEVSGWSGNPGWGRYVVTGGESADRSGWRHRERQPRQRRRRTGGRDASTTRRSRPPRAGTRWTTVGQGALQADPGQ